MAESGRWRAVLRTPVSVAGLLLACWAYVEALRPSLLPRSTVLQAAVCALAMVVAYALGAAAGAVARRVNAGRVHASPGGRRAVLVLVVAAVVAALVLTVPRASWQADPAIGWGWHADLVARGPRCRPALRTAGARRARRAGAGPGGRPGWSRRVPRRAAAALLGAATVAVGGAALLAGSYLALLAVFDSVDAATAGQAPPTSDLRSGGPASLVAWQTLGREGRTYVTSGPTVEQIASVAGTSAALQPIRVFAGLDSAPDAQARAALAVAELDRTDAFSRSAVLVITTTGNGFIDPVAADSAELVLGGDVASAAIQYSTLPSWLSFLVDQQASQEAGRALYQAVLARVGRCPSRRGRASSSTARAWAPSGHWPRSTG